MKHPTVRIVGLDNDAKQVKRGTITLRDGKLITIGKESASIVQDEIVLGSDRITAKDEPERFLRSLYLQYKSLYCLASKAGN